MGWPGLLWPQTWQSIVPCDAGASSADRLSRSGPESRAASTASSDSKNSVSLSQWTARGAVLQQMVRSSESSCSRRHRCQAGQASAGEGEEPRQDHRRERRRQAQHVTEVLAEGGCEVRSKCIRRF